MKIHSQVDHDVQALKRKLPLWRRLMNLAILAGVVALAVRYVDFTQVWKLIISADWRYVLLVLALATTSRFLMAWKWHRLLLAAEVPAAFVGALGAYYRSSMVSQVPFMVIGADLLRMHWIGSRLGKRAVVAATVVMEKALGLISAFFLGTLGLSLILAAHRAGEQSGTLMVVGLVGLVASLLLLGLSLLEGLHLRMLQSRLETGAGAPRQHPREALGRVSAGRRQTLDDSPGSDPDDPRAHRAVLDALLLWTSHWRRARNAPVSSWHQCCGDGATSWLSM